MPRKKWPSRVPGRCTTGHGVLDLAAHRVAQLRVDELVEHRVAHAQAERNRTRGRACDHAM